MGSERNHDEFIESRIQSESESSERDSGFALARSVLVLNEKKQF
jgi:hypothetical protein